MQQTADGRERFELLLKQAEIPTAWFTEYFADGYIHKVEVHKSSKSWKFQIGKRELLPAAVYISWLTRLREKLGHLADISVLLAYEETVPTSRLLEQYWPLFVEWMQRQNASVNGWLAKAQYETDDNLLTLALLDEMSLELA